MSTSRRIRALFTAALAALVLLTSAVSPASASKGKALRVAVFGDSLSAEARDAVTFFAGENVRVDFWVFGGTAPCDHFASMRKAKATGLYDAVVTAWAGNQLTPCAQGDPFQVYGGAMRMEKAIWGRTPMAFVMPPSPVAGTPTEAGVNRARDIAQYMGALLNVRVIDSQAMFVNGGGVSTGTAPCLSFEPCVGLVDSVTGAPSNPVRSADGLHFCPEPFAHTPSGKGILWDGSHSTCSGYSSGAVRYALALLSAAHTAAGR